MKGQYSISDLEAITGIKAHTIRIWEQRYELLHPSRSETNIRSYSDFDLKKLLNITTLQRYGWKISKLGNLTTEEFNHELKKHITTNTGEDDFIKDSIDELIISLLAMDEAAFSDVFELCTRKISFLSTIEKIIFPMMVKIGLLWNMNELIPAQEHFISNLVKMKIMAATNELPFENLKGEKIILFTPENEFHDLGLILVNYLLRSKGYHTIYLGQSVPFDNIQSTNEITGATRILFSVTITTEQDKFIKYLKKFKDLVNFKAIYMMANKISIAGFKIPPYISTVENPDQLYGFLSASYKTTK